VLVLKGDQTFLPPLAGDAHNAPRQVHIFDVETDELGEAKSGGIEQLQNRAIAAAERARCVRCFEQARHLVH
jgi:hypothetical protein